MPPASSHPHLAYWAEQVLISARRGVTRRHASGNRPASTSARMTAKAPARGAEQGKPRESARAQVGMSTSAGPSTVSRSAGRGPSTSSSAAAAAFEAAWPYRPLAESASRQSARVGASASTGTCAGAEEVRTIFAKPLSFSPWKRILGATALAWFGVVWFEIPDKPKMEDWWSRKDVGLFKRIAGSAFNTIFEHIPFIAIAGALVSVYRTSHALRVVTRLDQVRKAGSGTGTETYLAVTTGRSKLFPSFLNMANEPRRLDLGDVVLSGVKNARGPVVDMTVKPTTVRPVGTDKRAYWVDLRDSAAHQRLAEKNKEDYVISFNRLQHVFGAVPLKG